MFKKSLSDVGLALASLFLFYGSVPALAQSWSTMTQAQRNEVVLSAGEGMNDSNIGRYGGQCKTWVQNIVWAASKYTVWLPTNASDNYQWALYPGDHVVQMTPVVGPQNPLSLQPGWILQLARQNNAGPHTAIVVMASNSGIVLLDSNWAPPNAGIIAMHAMTWVQFNSAFARYTAYEVAW